MAPNHRISKKDNVKIFVLFLMENINYPLDFISINDIVMQTDYVMYLDFAEGFHEMLDNGLIECVEAEGEKYYYATEKGRFVARELSDHISPSILDQSLVAAFRYLDFKKRDITVSCRYEKRQDGRFDFFCGLYEKKECIFETKMVVDTEYHAHMMQEHFYDHPEALYRGTVSLLTGKVDFLFDDRAWMGKSI